MNDDLSRRDLLKRVGLAGAAAAVPGDVLAQVASARAPLETLTPAEADTLDAIVARLVPTDATGPGATEAKAARYIDRALGGALASFRDTYRAGLAAVDAYARASKGAPFAKLSAQNQDAVLTDMEMNAATGFTTGSAVFLQRRARAHHSGNVLRPVLWRQRSLRRLGSDRISRHSPGRHGKRSIDARAAIADAHVRVRLHDVRKKKPARALLTAGDDHHGGLISRRPTSSSSVSARLAAVAALPLAQAGLEVIGLEAGTWLRPDDFAPDELRNKLSWLAAGDSEGEPRDPDASAQRIGAVLGATRDSPDDERRRRNVAATTGLRAGA
jgi:hypothetical protein